MQMFQAARDYDREVRASTQNNWFNPPNGVEFKVKLVQDFYLSKSPKVGDKYRTTQAILFFKGYLDACLDTARTYWRKLYSVAATPPSPQSLEEGGEQKQLEAHDLTADFKFDSTTSHKPDSERNLRSRTVDQKRQSEMSRFLTELLLYNLKYVLDRTLLARVARWRTTAVDPMDLSWNDALKVIQQHMVSEHGDDLLERLVVMRREKGLLLLDWVVRVAQVNSALFQAGDELSQQTVLRIISRQMTAQEKKEVGKVTTLAALESKVNVLDYQQMAAYDPNEHPEILSTTNSLPVKPNKKNKRVLEKSVASKPSCTYCNHPTHRHTADQCMKRKADDKKRQEGANLKKKVSFNLNKSTNQPNNVSNNTNNSNNNSNNSNNPNNNPSKSKRIITCHTCGAIGHKSYNCPKKTAVSSFLAQVKVAEEKFGEKQTKEAFSAVVTVPINGPEPTSRAEEVTLGLGRITDANGHRVVIMALDSFCSHNIFAPGVGIVSNQSPSGAYVKGYGDNYSSLGAEATVELDVGGRNPVTVVGYQAITKESLPEGCEMMLSKSTMKAIGLDLNRHIYTSERVPIPLQFCTDENMMRKEPETVQDEQNQVSVESERLLGQIYMAESKVQSYLARPTNKLVTKRPETTKDIEINTPRLTPAQYESVLAAIDRVEAAFHDGLTLPPPLNMEPHQVKFKPNITPSSVPCRPWSPARRRYLTIWAQQMLDSGLYEWAEHSAWSSNVHLAYKEGPRGAERDKWEIRPCGDYPAVNDRIAKMAPNMPNLRSEIEKHGNNTWCIETDGAQAFHQVPLAEGASRDAFTVMTPIGKIRPTRLVEGSKNAATVLQGAMNQTKSRLPPHIQELYSNYMDDWNGTMQVFLSMLEGFVVLLLQFIIDRVTARASKTRIAFTTATFGGFETGGGTRRLAEKHMAPLKELQPPKNLSELRSCLGVFVQQKRYIKDYSIFVSPLTRLTGKVPWVWKENEQKAFNHIKELCCARPELANPDYSKPFYIDPDASELGYGFALFQLPDDDRKVEEEVEQVLDVLEINPETRRVIYYDSQSWNRNSSLAHMPPFYKEGHAAFYAIDKCRYYIDASPFVTLVFTDHLPLKWIRHSNRGLLTPWILEKVAGLTYEIVHRPGKYNHIGDAMSRPPFVEAGYTTPDMQRTVRALLDFLGPQHAGGEKVWVNTGRDTRVVARQVQQWRGPRNPIHIEAISTHRVQNMKWDLAVLKPSGGDAPGVCAELLRRTQPFAILVPSDLVMWVPLDSKRVVQPALEVALDQATKLVSLDTGLTWIVGNSAKERCVQLFASEVRGAQDSDEISGSNGDDLTDSSGETTDTESEPEGEVDESWVKAQRAEGDNLRKQARGNAVELTNGLLVDVVSGQTAKVIVPTSLREELIRKTHINIKHRGYKKTLETLRNTYTWAGMPTQVRKLVLACEECALMNGKRQLAHGQFSSVVHTGPRQAYGIDFYQVAKSVAGYQWILTVIDLFSREVMFLAMKTRQATELVQSMIKNVVHVNGVFRILMSDEAKEFVGKLVQGLCTALNIKHITTMGYDARRNAICEAVHAFLGRCFVLMSEDQRGMWEHQTNAFAFAHNTVIHSTIGMTPFELGHGMPAVTLSNYAVAIHNRQTDVKELDRDAAVGYYGRLKKAYAAYAAAAKRFTANAHEDQNLYLNKKGRAVSFSVGDSVKILFPSRGSDNWKAKHSKNWRGPMKVVKKLSQTTYQLEDMRTGQSFERSITNINAYRADVTDVKMSKAAMARETERQRARQGFVPGDMVACKDSEQDTDFWVARTLEMTPEGDTRVHYWGTRGRALKSAVFKPAYIGARTGKTILTNDTSRAGESCAPWTGVVPLDCVVGRVKLTAHGRMKPASAEVVTNLVMARL